MGTSHKIDRLFPTLSKIFITMSDDLMSKLMKKDKDEILAEFKKADADGNGKLTAGELKKLLEGMCEDAGETETTSEKEMDFMIQMVLNMADEDGDKMINYEEMIKAMTSEPSQEDIMKAMFKMCDTDGDGKLTRKELTKMMKMMADDDEEVEEAGMMVKMMMTMADEDEDGKLTFEEYSKMMS